MATSHTIPKLGVTLALLGLFLLAQTAESERVLETPADAVTNDWADVDMLVEEETSDDASEGGSDSNLDSLEKTWKAKEARAQTAYQATATAQKAKLREHVHQERLAKMSMQLQVDVSADDSAPGKTIPARGATDVDKAKELAKAQESITHLKQQVKDEKLKAKLAVKKAAVDAKQDADKTLADTKIKYRKKLDAASKQLIKDHQREASMVKQVVKDRTKKESTKVKLQDMAKRHDKRKDQYKKVVEDNVALKGKLVQEKALRQKAVDTALQLGKKIRTLGMFGKKSAQLAKDQALKAEKASADAKDQVSLVKAEKTKANEEAARLKAEKTMEEQKLAELKAQFTALQAQGLHEKTNRRETEKTLVQTQTQLKEALVEEDGLKAKILKHKLEAKRLAKEAGKRKSEEKKALAALEKVGVIQKALTVAQHQVERYRNENKLQRAELSKATERIMVAAKVTKSGAEDAERIEQEALEQRHQYQGVVEQAKNELAKEHELRMGAQHQSDALLEKAKLQLQQEHKLRVSAQDEVKRTQASADKASAQAVKDHNDMLAVKADAAKITADRDQLMQRAKAATDMIAVEQEATEEAKKAAADIQQADSKKLADLTSQYDQKLAQEHAKSEQAESIAKTITDRTGALQEAIAHQKEILKEEQAKAQNERGQWHKAMDAFNKERSAHMAAKGAMDESAKAMAQKAQFAIQRATQLAKDKDTLLGQLKDQLKTQASKFAGASKDWAKVKRALQLRVRTAEEAASDANAKLAELAKRQEDDSAADTAETAVERAMDSARSQAGTDMELMQEESEFLEEPDY